MLLIRHVWHKLMTLKLFVKHVVLTGDHKLMMFKKVYALWKVCCFDITDLRSLL